MQHQAQQSQRNLKTIPLPTSDVTLFALDILLENTGKKFNGRELQNKVEEKLGRPINYAGLLKQLRAYATKPGWNIVLKIDPQSDHQLTSPRDLKNAQINIRTRPTLAIYAQDNVVSHKLHALMHKLNDIKEAMNELSALKEGYDAEQKRVFSDPYCDLNEARAKRTEIKTKLEQLASRID